MRLVLRCTRGNRSVVFIGRTVDALAALLGVCLGLPSLTFPFGHDQGLYYYVGREWLLRGALPYRDLLEQKTPGIFLLHALAIVLFGERMWGIRVLELGAVLLLGLLASEAAPYRPPGIRGVGVLMACTVYYGFFNFWDTGQCEIWVALFIALAVLATRRARTTRGAALVAGLACGVALVIKPPAASLTAVCMLLLYVRIGKRARRREYLLASAIFTAFAALPWVLVVAYFFRAHALGAMVDVVVRANAYYARHEPASTNPFEFTWRALTGTRIWGSLGMAMAVAVLVGWKRARDRHDRAVALAYMTVVLLGIGSLLAVCVQAKFYYYHWGLFVAPEALAATCLVADLHGWALRRRWAYPASSAVALVTVVLYLTSNSVEYPWFWGAKPAALRAFGRSSSEDFDSYFHVESLGYDAHNNNQVADWLIANSSPVDRVAVRGFAPEIYALSRRHFGGRFFWTLFLTMPSRAYRRDEWLAEDRADIEHIRPRFVVALRAARDGPDSPSFFLRMGYATRIDLGAFEILEDKSSGAETSARHSQVEMGAK